jgi:hypothetical protein
MTNTTFGSDQHGRFHAHIRYLSKEIAELTADWDAVEEVDTNLGADVETLGCRLVCLLDDLHRRLAGVDAQRGSQLLRFLRELNDAVDYYAELDEHETHASVDIFDRLAPGIAIAHRRFERSGGPERR